MAGDRGALLFRYKRRLNPAQNIRAPRKTLAETMLADGCWLMRVYVSAEALENCSPVRIDADIRADGRLPRLEANGLLAEPGRSPRCGLFARCAGVHVDFHAHRDFDNLRSFPGHSFLPSILGAMWRRGEG